MGTVIRPETSKKNKYWIPRHRYHELKHFCLQYPLWKKAYLELQTEGIKSSSLIKDDRASGARNGYGFMEVYFDGCYRRVVL